MAGPYGGIGGSRKYLVASLDQSLKRMGLDYVDIFYSHRVDPTTPLEETMGALAHLHRQGKALYVGISSYSPELTRKAAAILAEERVPLFIHQPNYSMFNRWIEGGLLDTLEELGTGCIAFSPLAQGLLTSKYLKGVPADARATREGSLGKDQLSEANLERIRALNAIAERRGQTLAQMAIAWSLRDPRVDLVADRRAHGGTTRQLTGRREGAWISRPESWPRSTYMRPMAERTSGASRRSSKTPGNRIHGHSMAYGLA